jgi:hypothetical protein
LNERVSWVAWNRIIKETSRKAGINGKRVHHYLLRHGSATEAAQFLTDSELKVLYGWTMSSRMPQVYIHLSAKDIDPKLEQIYSGKVIQPPKPEFSPILCPKCSERNTPGMSYCGRCGTPLNQADLMKASIEDQVLKNELQDVKRMVSQLLSQPSRGSKESSQGRIV